MEITSDRKLVMQLNCDMAFRWFVGLGRRSKAWDASTFSQNRRRRFDKSGFADKGYFAQGFITALFERRIEPHMAAQDRGRAEVHRRVRMRER